MSATVRFSQLVETCGKPELHVLWGPPESDRDFQRAVKSHRVMTIHQENVGSKKDFGVIGFSQDRPAQFLIFPKSLKPFAGRRVVGIKYESLEPRPAPRAASRNRPEARSEKRSERHHASASPKSSPLASSQAELAEASASSSKTTMPSLPIVEERKEPVPSRRPAALVPAAGSGPFKERAAVLKEVRATMKELEAGKAVVAFRRLEKLAEKLAAQENSGADGNH